MNNKEELTLDSELLKPVKELMEETINRLMRAVINNNKKAEITIKIGLDKEEKTHVAKHFKDCSTWTEPRITCKVTEKIKEFKETNEYLLRT